MLGDLERGDAQAREPALGEAEDVALLAQLEVLLGQGEPVVRLGDGLEPGRARSRRSSRRRGRRTTRPMPRPTRPRSWWSWASPNRSAPWMIIIVAAGTSTPTSTTVVPTRTSSSPSRKRVISASRSAGFSRPWTIPTRSGASSAAQADRLALGRDRAVALVGAFLDQRHDDERPVAERGLLADLVATSRRGRSGACGSRSGSRPGRPAASAGRRRRGRRRGPGRASAGSASRSSAGRAASGRRPWPRAAPRWSTPKRCCSSMTTRPRSANETASWMSAWVPTTTSAWPDAIASSALALTSALSEPVSSVTPIPSSVEQRPDRLEVLAREQVGRREQRALEPGPCRRGERVRGDRGLARPDVALEQAQHRRRAGEVVADRVHRDGLVGRQLDRRARRAPPIASTSAVRTDVVRGVVDGDLRRRVADPLAAARDHPELEREQLVEGEPAQRRVAALERVRVVGLLDRPGDRHEPLLGDDRRPAGTRGRRSRPCRAPRGSPSGGGPRSGRPSAGRPARSGRRGAARCRSATTWNSGLSRVSRRPKCLTLPDTTTSAPTGSRRSMKRRPNQVASMLPVSSSSRAIVRWIRPRKPGSTRTSPTRRLGRDDRAVRAQHEVAELAHLAQVVVAPRQVEEQVADGVEVEPDPGPPERRPGRQPGPRQRGRQQLDRIGRDGCDGSLPWPPYSAEIRYR